MLWRSGIRAIVSRVRLAAKIGVGIGIERTPFPTLLDQRLHAPFAACPVVQTVVPHPVAIDLVAAQLA